MPLINLFCRFGEPLIDRAVGLGDYCRSLPTEISTPILIFPPDSDWHLMKSFLSLMHVSNPSSGSPWAGGQLWEYSVKSQILWGRGWGTSAWSKMFSWPPSDIFPYLRLLYWHIDLATSFLSLTAISRFLRFTDCLVSATASLTQHTLQVFIFPWSHRGFSRHHEPMQCPGADEMVQRYRKRLVLRSVTQCYIKLHHSEVNSLLLYCSATFDCLKPSHFSEEKEGKRVCKLFYPAPLIATIVNQTLQQITAAFNSSWKPKHHGCGRNNRLSCGERGRRGSCGTIHPWITTEQCKLNDQIFSF